MPSTILSLLIGFAAGAAAGLFYFSALWASVRGLTAECSLRKLVLGAALRLGAVLGALWLALAAGVGGPTALAAVPGFVIARMLVTRWVRPAATEG